MTRKEPKFNDDLTTSVSVGLPKEPARDQSKSASQGRSGMKIPQIRV